MLETLVTLHYTGWLTGILIMPHYSPLFFHWVIFHPLYNPTNQVEMIIAHFFTGQVLCVLLPPLPSRRSTRTFEIIMRTTFYLWLDKDRSNEGIIKQHRLPGQRSKFDRSDRCFPSLKLTANAPENRPKRPKRKRESPPTIHFQGRKC